MTIPEYVGDLKQTLALTLAQEDVEEAIAEVQVHLEDRRDELAAADVAVSEAEQRAVQEFGALPVIIKAFKQTYPPKPPLDPKKVAWVPEAFMMIWLGIAAYVLTSTGGFQGVVAVASMAVTNSTMLVIPGLFGGLGRLKYRKLRIVKLQVRMANYGIGMALLGGVILVGVTLAGKNTLAGLLPFHLCFVVTSSLGYLVMRMSLSNGKGPTILRGLLRMR